MPIGLAAGLMLAGTAGSAAATIGAAKIQSNAAKRAQKEQQAATDKAMAVQTQQNQPYLDLGRQAAQRLQNMPFQPYMQTFGSGRGAQLPTPPPQGPQGPPPGSLASLGQPGGQMMPPGSAVPPQAVQRIQQAMPQRMQPGLPPGMVRLPDGRVVPQGMAPQIRGL